MAPSDEGAAVDALDRCSLRTVKRACVYSTTCLFKYICLYIYLVAPRIPPGQSEC